MILIATQSQRLAIRPQFSYRTVRLHALIGDRQGRWAMTVDRKSDAILTVNQTLA